MANITYVNGRYLPKQQATVHIEDRGYQFADGIYEYIAFYNQRLLDGSQHLARLERSLEELSIDLPMSVPAMQRVIKELIARNGRRHGGLYMQVTRGVAKRDHPFPKASAPSFVMTICAPKFPKPHEIKNGVHVITQPDMRWGRCDIKSIALLANVLAKQEATKHQAREAWLIASDDQITEGAVSNTYIVNKAGTVITHPLNNRILGGVTRDTVIGLARKNGVDVIERPFTLSDIKQATEAFMTSTSINVLPVVKIDGTPVGSGVPGDITKKLQRIYVQYILKHTGYDFT